MGETNGGCDDALFQRISDMSLFTRSCLDILVDQRLTQNFASAIYDDRLTNLGRLRTNACPRCD